MVDTPIDGGGTLPMLITLPPALSDTYMGVASAMLGGVNALSGSATRHTLPFAMLAAHALECALKAYLSRQGDDKAVRQHDVRHNLNLLWSMAHAGGLSIPSDPPAWVGILSDIHNAPYHLRYSRGINAISTPGAEPLTSELNTILKTVYSQLR